MPEELASYHIPDGEPKHVASVNFLARLKEAEARLKAAQEKARLEAAAAAQAAATAEAAAAQEEQARAQAAEEADRHARHAANAAKVHKLEDDVARRLRPKRIIATLIAGLLFGTVLIATYELVYREQAAAPTPVPSTQPAGQTEIVPVVPSQTTESAEPDRGIPPGLE